MKKDTMVNLLFEFYNERGRVPKRFEKYKNLNIGEFYSMIRNGRCKLTMEQKKSIISSGIYLGRDKRTIRTHDKVQKLIQFKKKYNKLPCFTDEVDGIYLKSFLDSIISKKTKISKSDEKLLIENGIDLKYYTKEEKMEEKLNAIIDFYNEYGKPPSHLATYKGINIGRFFKSIKYGEIKNSEKYKKILKQKGIIK